MTSFAQLLDVDGHTRADMVLRGDGVLVLTASPTDPDSLAYQAWVAAGGVLDAPLPTPGARLLDFIGFLALFTTTESAAIVASNDPRVRLFCLMAAGAPSLSLADTRVQGGVALCRSLGLIASDDRVAAILAGTPPAA